ncbi:hypothetical protein Y032_0067g18 [Ancylostoma ceylanicum]|uniref:Uncharacterized protein n=1 Tax=Ancylostoma ceylanicum TaxID=53326 RepID=A0A016U0L0_9BILA|nr:hypothetical protein Y032_0067g18 [Ancylostoma ceylanicum]
MKSVKRFFSTIAKKIGVDMMEDNEDLLKPFRPVKKDEQGPKADQQKAQRGTDSSHTEDLLTPFKDIKRGSRGSETQSTTQTAASVSVDHTNASPLSCIPASVRKKKYRKMEMEDRRRDNGEIDVSLRVQSAKDKPNDISSSSTHPLVDENKSVVRR